MAVYTFDDFEIDLTLYQLRRSDCVVDIGPRNFDVLAYLVRHRDRLVGKEELVERVWGVSAMSGSSVPTAIAAVRRALGDDPAAPVYVETVRGRGYRFVAEVSEIRGEGGIAAGPKLGEGEGRYAFVGRERELAALYAAFERTLGRTPQLVLVAGEAGIGKTRTVEEFLPLVRDDGAAVLVGHCREDEGAPAFWPWVQIVRACVEQGAPSGLLELLGDLGPDLARMVPELRERFPELPEAPPMDADQARFRLFEAVGTFIRGAAAERPLVLWLDDLHRADAASLALLRFTVRELREAQVLFVGTYRDVDLQRDAEKTDALASIAREEPSRSLVLNGLEPDEVRALIADAMDDPAPPEAFTAALYEQTRGNPFFLTQLVHLLEVEGRLRPETLGSLEHIALPGGVREAVARQLDALEGPARRILSVASVFGREFPTRALAAAVGPRDGNVIAAIEAAVSARLLAVPPGRVGHYRFAHVLVRDAVYDLLDPVERARLHAVIGEALEALYADRSGAHAAELAHHFLAASTAEARRKAIHHARRAGEWATATLGYEDAPAHYQRALDTLDLEDEVDGTERCELLLALGEARMRAADRTAAQATLKQASDLARELGDADLLGRAALALAPGFFAIEVGVYDPVLVALIEEALEALGDKPSPLRAQLLARQAMALTWSSSADRRAQLSLEAIRTARSCDAPLALAHALSARHGDLWSPERFEERMQVIDELGALASHPRDAELSLLHRVFRITALLESGQIHAVDREIDSFARVANELRQPHSMWYVDLYRAMRALMEGRFAEAEELAVRFHAVGSRVDDVNSQHSFVAQIAIARWEQGGEDFLDGIEDLVSRFPAVIAWRCSLAFLYAEAGRLKEAAREFDRVAAHAIRAFSWDETSFVTLCLLADVCAALEDRDRVNALYDLLVRGEDRFAVIGYASAFLGSVSLRLARLNDTLGRRDQAHSYFELALHQHRAVGASPWIARTGYHFARFLIAGYRNPKIGTLIEESLDLSRRLGLRSLEQKIVELDSSL